MMKIKNMVVNIQMVLSNFTGLVLNETSEMGLEDALACEAYDVATPPACNAREERSTEEVEVEEEEGESEQTGQLTRSSSSVSSSEQQGEQEGTGSLRRAVCLLSWPSVCSSQTLKFCVCTEECGRSNRRGQLGPCIL